MRGRKCEGRPPHGVMWLWLHFLSLTKSSTSGLLLVRRMMCATSNACATLWALYLYSFGRDRNQAHEQEDP